MFALILSALAFVPMLFEARHAARNERALRAQGAVEPPGDVYPLMRFAYPACFAGMIAEAWLRAVAADRAFVAGLAVFCAAKALKYWAVRSLGSRWSFRVLVPPRSSPISTGPYRYVRHPNYVGVIGELAGMAVMARAPLAGAASLVAFAALILARVRVENRALGQTPPVADTADG